MGLHWSCTHSALRGTEARTRKQEEARRYPPARPAPPIPTSNGVLPDPGTALGRAELFSDKSAFPYYCPVCSIFPFFFLLLPADLSLVLLPDPRLGTVWVALLLNTEFKIRHCLWLLFEFSLLLFPSLLPCCLPLSERGDGEICLLIMLYSKLR